MAAIFSCLARQGYAVEEGRFNRKVHITDKMR